MMIVQTFCKLRLRFGIHASVEDHVRNEKAVEPEAEYHHKPILHVEENPVERLVVQFVREGNLKVHITAEEG